LVNFLFFFILIFTKQPAPLVQGHWKDEVWGLAMHPTDENVYATVGDDQTLRVWNIKEQSVVGQTKVEGMARSVAISPDASMIAVGLGGSVGRGKDKMDGWVYIYDGQTKKTGFEELEQAQTMHHAKGWISDVKFSPDGATLAVGSHDNKIYIYDIYPPAFPENKEEIGNKTNSNQQQNSGVTVRRKPDEFANNANEAMKGRSVCLRGICKGHSSYITHLDFSEDSNWLQTTCGAYELLFWDVRSPTPGQPYIKSKPAKIRQQTNATAMRDVDWHTWTCTLGWPVQGIWPKCADGTDINAVDLNGSPSMHDKSKKKKTLITADDSGKLKMFRWPCIEKGSPFSVESGHASHVTNVRWNANSKWVVSTGGNDRCVFQWQLIKEEELDESKHEFDGEHPEDLTHFDPFDGTMGGGDEFSAVKPWRGQIAVPSEPIPSNPLQPEVDIELEWIFGYRSQDCHDNMRYSASGDIIYHSAAVGIVLNDKTEDGEEFDKKANPYSQRFFREHDDDIVCMAVDPKGRYVATGQVQSSKSRKMKPCVKIWDAESCRPICTLGQYHKRAVTSVAFSADGKWCGTVGEDNNHSVAVWGSRTGQWNDGKLLTTCRGDPGKTLFLAFAGDSDGEFNFVTGGVSHIRFWKVTGHTMKSKKGILGQNVPPTKGKSVFCTAIGLGKNYFAAGMHSGYIYVFCGNKLIAFADAHKSSTSKTGCQTLHLKTDPNRSADEVHFVSGGSDGQIILWEFTFPKKGGSEPRLQEIRNSRFNISSITPRPKNHCIRSVCWDGSLSTILIGTKGSEAYTIGTEGNNINKDKVKLLFSGHYQDEVWGLAPHPMRPDVLATCGDDMTLRVWRTGDNNHQCLAVGELKGMSRAVAWKPDGQWLIVGLGGRVGRRTIKSGHKKKKKDKSDKKSRKSGKSSNEDPENYDGHFMIFEVKQSIYESGYVNYESLTPYLERPQELSGRLPNNWISDVKFSPSKFFLCTNNVFLFIFVI
jgi:WD40 repeat protein